MSSGRHITVEGWRDTKRQGLSLYFVLLAVQTVGIAILLANLIPLYRLMSVDFKNYRPDPRSWWAFAGILLIQVAYWLRVRLKTPLPRRKNVVLGHIVLFVSRLTFVSVTASFSLMFFTRFDALKALNYPPLRALLVLVIFFSIFCWTLEVERLGKALDEPDKGSADIKEGPP